MLRKLLLRSDRLQQMISVGHQDRRQEHPNMCVAVVDLNGIRSGTEDSSMIISRSSVYVVPNVADSIVGSA